MACSSQPCTAAEATLAVFSKRIEITRERVTRITLRADRILLCETCGAVVELATTRVGGQPSPEHVDDAVSPGLFRVWTAGKVRLVCWRCAAGSQECK